MIAQAYANYGRWIADCPQPGCTDARLVFDPANPSGPPVTHDTCADGHPFDIELPGNADAIMTALHRRTNEAHRDWYPADFPRAVAAGLRTGQTVAQIDEETALLNQARTDDGDSRAAAIRQLEALGLTVRADGTIGGRL